VHQTGQASTPQQAAVVCITDASSTTPVACTCYAGVLCREILCFEGYRSPWYKQLLFVVLGVCTGGVLFLVAKWSLTVRTALRLKRCRLADAQFVRTTVCVMYSVQQADTDGSLQALHSAEPTSTSPSSSRHACHGQTVVVQTVDSPWFCVSAESC
jgi:hypothetical protein